jgi:hypothetical protein
MAYAVFFSFGVVALAYGAWTNGAWFAALAAWPIVTGVTMSLAYVTNRPGILGKRADGTLAPRGWLLCAPWFLFSLFVTRLIRRFDTDAPFHRVADTNLVIGRRLVDGELPADIEHVVDLTAEFFEVASIRGRKGYRALPILDARFIAPQRIVEAVRGVPADAPVYIHCAQGYGRTALFAAAVLVARGKASTGRDAFRILRAVRPRVYLGPAQKRALNDVVALLVR